jgi:predicted exporter
VVDGGDAPGAGEPVSDSGWIRSDGQGFFPPEVGALVARLNAFPIARWNFLVVDPPPAGTDDGPMLLQICDALKSEAGRTAEFQCRLTTSAPTALAAAWAKDQALREPLPPPADVQEAVNLTLAKASLPLDPALRAVLRADPFGTYQTILTRLETQKPIKLVVRDDMLVEPSSGRVLIPMLLHNDPLDAEPAAEIERVAEKQCAAAKACDRIGFLGGHFATLENKRQVMNDLQAVTGSGIACLLGGLLLLALLKQLRLLWILAPVTIGILAAGLAVVAGYGSIHGLALSFGTGLVGLSIDYGVYTSFQSATRGVWRSNLAGVLTTLVVLGVLAFSAIPVLRQLMTFSLLGLGFSFLSIYAVHRVAPRRVAAAPLRLPRSRRLARVAQVVALILALGGAAGLAVPGILTYDLSVQRLSFMKPKTQELYQWFGKVTKLTSLFVMRATTPGILTDLENERAWADGAGIRTENAAAYLPALREQRANLATWITPDCAYAFAKDLDETQRRFFAPYLAGRPCEQVAPRDLEHGAPPAYLNHLAGKGDWLSVFFPNTPEQRDRILARYPSAFAMTDLANRFPVLFKSELSWMTPVALGLVGLVLLLYYRSLAFALAAVLPFLAGAGAVAVAAKSGGLTINFVTLVALLMLLGLSTDWGIFAVDGWRRRDGASGRTASALLLCCLSSTLGVLPLVFAAHPVLRSLGAPLAIGLAGALLGSLVAVPAALALGTRRFGDDWGKDAA